LADPVAVNASQSDAPPEPFVNVTVTLAPPVALVVLTVRLGADAEIVSGRAADVPPPGVTVRALPAVGEVQKSR
jgi:hypothetical protein